MPVCIHCSNNVEFEVHECQQICPLCGTIASSEYLTTDSPFQLAPFPFFNAGTHTQAISKAFSVYPDVDTYLYQRKNLVTYLHQCARVLQMEQHFQIILDIFSMLVPEKEPPSPAPKFRWGSHGEATAIACCILASRKYGKYISIREASGLLNVDPFFIGRYVSEASRKLFQEGHVEFQFKQTHYLHSVTQKWLTIFLSRPEEYPLPSYVKIDPPSLPTVQHYVKVLIEMAESVFEGHLLEPTALSIVIMALEVLHRSYLEVLPIAIATRMSPTTLLQRQRDWHHLFYRLSRQVPWSKDIRRTNFPCFFYQLLELVEHDVGLVDVGLPISYLKTKKSTDAMKERIAQAQCRLAQATVPTSFFTSMSNPASLENLDAAIEFLLTAGELPQHLDQLSPTEVMALYQSRCMDTTSALTHDLHDPTLTSLDLTAEEEDLYLRSFLSLDETEKSFVETRNRIGLTVNQWKL